VINPQDAGAYSDRGLAYSEMNEYSKALSDCTKAIAINPQLARAYGCRGVVYILTGNKQKALQDLQISAALFQKQGEGAKYEWVMQLIQKL
jgi:tetratricopeptide (TPR) repeat protein